MMSVMPKIIAGKTSPDSNEMTKFDEFKGKHFVANRIEARKKKNVVITHGQHAFARLGFNI